VKAIRIGCGAGYSGDRIEPAIELATRGDLGYLVFECLAERTIAIAQKARAADPDAGYDPLLVDRMTAVLPACMERGVTILTNMGAANPLAAARVTCRVARDLGLRGLKVAAVMGDDVLDIVRAGSYPILETGEPVDSLGARLVSANAYLGAESLMPALAAGANVVISGRVADPSLFVAPLAHEFRWPLDDWPLVGRGTLVGHLLECAGQVTGGYYADPGFADVDGLGRLGFPLAEVSEDGSAIITKVAGSGGRVTPATCKEQLLYEIHDPASYVTPDVIADFSRVRISEAGSDSVSIQCGDGKPRPSSLKVSLGYTDGFIGEGQISYAGPGAVARGRLALKIVEERLRLRGVQIEEARYDVIGVDALHGPRRAQGHVDPYEVRIRVAARTRTMKDAARVTNEVETLYTNGPAGGGGASGSAREVLAVASTLIPRDLVKAAVHYEAV
jgi:Acyclic terpene utilisation family protein AtuA